MRSDDRKKNEETSMDDAFLREISMPHWAMQRSLIILRMSWSFIGAFLSRS